MRVQFFGRLSDRIGREAEVDLPADIRTVADLRRLLARQHPQLEEDLLGRAVRACVDDEIVPDDAVIRPDSEVAFFPPLSGG